MTIIQGLSRAEARMGMYIDEAGAHATITRKSDTGWALVYGQVPLIVEANRTSSTGIDPESATANDANTRKITVSKATDIQRGDRIQVIAPRGSGISPGTILTVSTVNAESMAPCKTAVVAVEEVAVEEYNVTIERWNDTEGVFVPVFTAMAAVVADRSTVRAEQMGAYGQMRTGTLIFEPVPGNAIHPQDSITGIPWATGAFVTRLYPVVGGRLEVGFSFTTGEMT